MFLIKKHSIWIISIISLSGSATTLSDISMMGYPLDMVISGKAVKIDSCRDLVIATKNGGKIDRITSQLDNISFQQANAELLNCNISSQLAIIRGNISPDRELSVSNFLKHLPASAVPEPLDQDKFSLSNISIAKAWPDLKIKSAQAITAKGNMIILIRDRGEYTSLNGEKIRLITISMTVTNGTYGRTATYAIKDNKHKLWQLTPIDYNTKF